MNRLHLYRRPLVLVLVILGLVVSGNSVAYADRAQLSPTASPLLIDVSAAQSPGSVIVTGHGFTPGGEVYIALYDQWGMQLHETRWINASQTVYGPNGSQDPAAGFVEGGSANETFGTLETVYGPNGSQDPANGYIRGTSDTTIVGGSETVYGPNGSQDPATGFVPGKPGREIAGSLCGTTVMVRAYDQQTATWSNMLDADVGC